VDIIGTLEITGDHGFPIQRTGKNSPACGTLGKERNIPIRIGKGKRRSGGTLGERSVLNRGASLGGGERVMDR
jgi:hypothetical protein